MYIKIRVQWTYNDIHNNHSRYTNYITELSATILELIYENNKDSVTKNNQPVNGEHQQTN